MIKVSDHYKVIYKETECQRIDAFELWCWRRLLRVPWMIKPVNPKGNQSWTFIGRTDAETEAPILWQPDAKSWLIRKDHDAGKDWGEGDGGGEGGEGDDRGWDGWMASPTQWTWFLNKLWELVMDRETCRTAVRGVTESNMPEWLNWTEVSLLVLAMEICWSLKKHRDRQLL